MLSIRMFSCFIGLGLGVGTYAFGQSFAPSFESTLDAFEKSDSSISQSAIKTPDTFSMEFGLATGVYSEVFLPEANNGSSYIDGTVIKEDASVDKAGVGGQLNMSYTQPLNSQFSWESQFRVGFLTPQVQAGAKGSSGLQSTNVNSMLKTSFNPISNYTPSIGAGFAFSRHGFTSFSFGHFLDSYQAVLGANLKRGKADFGVRYFPSFHQELAYGPLFDLDGKKLPTLKLKSNQMSAVFRYLLSTNVYVVSVFDLQAATIERKQDAYSSYGLLQPEDNELIESIKIESKVLTLGVSKDF